MRPLRLLALATLLLGTGGCPQVACDCIAPGVTLTLELADAMRLEAVRASGDACSGTTPRCLPQNQKPCTQWFVDPRAPGICHIEVDFGAAGVVDYDVAIRRVEGDCCAGLYAHPTQTGQIPVTAPSTDGGAAG